MNIATDLGATGLHVQDLYLDAVSRQTLLQCAFARRERGEFRKAKVGDAQTLRRDIAVRGDSTCWLQEPLYPAERELLARLEGLRLTLNGELYWGLFDLELH